MSLNCAALPDTLADSELFGHLAGAFTGADRDRIGRVELAHRGTVFLDEVAELAPAIQVKLLRAVQFGEVERVGAGESRTVDVRWVAATNRDIREAVDVGRFREDLLFRLKACVLRAPTLRERAGDVPLLAAHFLERARSRAHLPAARITPAALARLDAHPWPGNVRELEHVITRALVLAARGRFDEEAVLDVPHFAMEGLAAPPEPQGLTSQLDAYERRLLEAALEEADGNWAEAARRLEVDRSNLRRRGRRLGLL